MINERFGTMRGLVRLGLSHVQWRSGNAAIRAGNPDTVRRLVFVCHGNICRSAFAQTVARRLGLRTASFGLSTSANQPAYGPAVVAAGKLGYDMTEHCTTRLQDFTAHAGDMMLGMEVRHLQMLASLPDFGTVPRSLLGLRAQPVVPHLHDPYQLDPRYMAVCLQRIETAVIALATEFPGATLSE